MAATNLYAADWFIIVDAVSNGNTIAPYIRQKAAQLNRDIKIIHVKSVPEYTDAFRPSFHPEHFDELYELNENGTNLMQIVNSLKKHENLIPALPGTEIAVPLADQINTRAAAAAAQRAPTAHIATSSIKVLSTAVVAGGVHR